MRRQIMFVTYLTDGFQKAFAYGTELATMMKKDIAILIISRGKNTTGTDENCMTEVAFTGSGENEITREFIPDNEKQDFTEEINYLWERCSETDIKLSIHRSALDIVTAINSFVRQERGIDIILIGSTITGNGTITAKELKRLVRTVSRPVVTIGEEACVT